MGSTITDLGVQPSFDIVQSDVSSAGGVPAGSSSSGQASMIPVIVAAIVAVVVIVVVVAVVVTKRAQRRPTALILGAAGAVHGDDWENPIYTTQARSVAFDNPIYDRLDNLV